VYAIDWLGMGRSARVPFTVKAKKEDISGRVNEAESFFIDSLEEWREKMRMEKMTLVGHSLGAYLSVAYALRYPTRVSKLILLSPAGVPRDPNDNSVPSKEFDDTQEDVKSAGVAKAPTQAQIEDMKKGLRRLQAQESKTRKLLTYLWEEGWSPFQIIRSSLFWSPLLVGKVCVI
jgi:cardiolipin-specific phospholipase